MLELTFENVEVVSGARRAAAEACLVVGGNCFRREFFSVR